MISQSFAVTTFEKNMEKMISFKKSYQNLVMLPTYYLCISFPGLQNIPIGLKMRKRTFSSRYKCFEHSFEL